MFCSGRVGLELTYGNLYSFLQNSKCALLAVAVNIVELVLSTQAELGFHDNNHLISKKISILYKISQDVIACVFYRVEQIKHVQCSWNEIFL